MGLKEYIGEDEASRIAGISTATLERFVEAGYLVLERDNDGLKLYAKEDLERLFGITLLSGEAPASAYSEVVNAAPFEQERSEKVVDLRVIGGGKFTQSQQTLNQTPSNTPQLEQPRASGGGVGIMLLEQEVTKLRNIMNLQEKLLELREGELAEAKKERDWLRGRVEKLEEKADRDQLILLSEAQTVRRLLTAHIERDRKSPVRAALEWFGFVPAAPISSAPRPEQQGATIEVSKQN